MNHKRPENEDIKEEKQGRHTKILSILAIVLFILFSITVGYFIGRPMLKFVSEPDQFRLWVDGHGIWGRLAFVGMVVLQVIIALIPGEPLEIGAGYAFGFWEGTLWCMIGVILGSALVFAMTRRWGTKIVQVFFPIEKIQSIKFMQNSKRLNTLTFVLFFIPGTPKDLLTYAAGLTPIRFSTYMVISNLARFPSVVTSTVGGNALGERQYLFAILTFVIVGVISVIGIFLYKQIAKAHEKKKSLSASTEPDESQDRN